MNTCTILGHKNQIASPKEIEKELPELLLRTIPKSSEINLSEELIKRNDRVRIEYCTRCPHLNIDYIVHVDK